MVFTLNLLPWFFVIGGLYCLFEEEAGTGIGLLVVGAVWLFIRYSTKKSGSASTTSTSPTVSNSSGTVSKNESPKAPAAKRSCPHCGAELSTDDTIYCSYCGNKL